MGRRERHVLQSTELLDKLKEDNSYENVVAYILAYVEAFEGYQGYYEYFGTAYGQYDVVKMHYRGEYRAFKLLDDSDVANGYFHFGCKGKAVIEHETKLAHEEETYRALRSEIHKRSYEDVLLKDLLAGLRKNLKPYFDLDKCKFRFYIRWAFKVEYEWQLY